MRSFFDTNVLVYLFDEEDLGKKTRAQVLLEKETAGGRTLLSTQVLQEFYVTVTRKLSVPLPAGKAEEVICELMTLPLVEISRRHILGAIRRSEKMRISFWDALIVEAAVSGGASVLFTEDLHHGQNIDGLQIQNPFLE